MNEEKYREMIEKMTNAEWIAFVNEKLQEIEIFEKILKEETYDFYEIINEGEKI